ncbi:hypothetical protein OW491_11780, partial [Neptunomonas sp. CHC150]|uniref:hypothetical protein n=1 Tax=Neptunomonas sp. CHC150 TaxID=2998324 RepID=UPI0025B18733
MSDKTNDGKQQKVVFEYLEALLMEPDSDETNDSVPEEILAAAEEEISLEKVDIPQEANTLITEPEPEP